MEDRKSESQLSIHKRQSNFQELLVPKATDILRKQHHMKQICDVVKSYKNPPICHLTQVTKMSLTGPKSRTNNRYTGPCLIIE